MSIGWPLASSQSARMFLRIGFRDTAAIGSAICVVGVLCFVLASEPVSLPVAIASTFVLGFGLGLLSVCTVVGPQSTVSWEQRGVVTGAVMFSRYLGQSLGAAIFGAVFNAAILHRLALGAANAQRSAAAPGERGRHSPGPVRATARRRRRLPPAGDLGRNARCLSRAGRGRGGDARRGARDCPAAVRDQCRSRGRSPRQLAHTRSGSSTWTSPVTGSRPVAIRAQVVSSHSPGSGAPARPSSTFRTSARAPGSAGGASSATVMSR